MHAYTSIVELITNPRIRLAVLIEGDNRPLSYRGAGSRVFGQPMGLAQYIPTDIQIEDRRDLPRLVTSGMGGVFPAGLQVGRISYLKQGAGGMFFDGDVVLDKRLSSLTEVAVMIRIPSEL